MYDIDRTRYVARMTETPIFQRILEFGPTTRGEGTWITLLWDGGERAILIALFSGHEVTADISPARLLADAKDLQEQACNGHLQVIFRSEELINQLEVQSLAEEPVTAARQHRPDRLTGFV